MIFLADADIDRLILEDIQQGDLTTRALGINGQRGEMRFSLRRAGRVSGISIVERIMQRLGLAVEPMVDDAAEAADGRLLLIARGRADALHQAWKVSQNVLEWCSGVAQATSVMIQATRAENPDVQIACTRKSIPGTRLLATIAILDGGALIHRAGTAETILLFANHRRFFPSPFDWVAQVTALRRAAPEKTIIVETDTPDEALLAMAARPDIIQLDKFTPEQITTCLTQAAERGYCGRFSAAGGIGLHNAAAYAATGVALLVTSAPYYAKPADVKVTLSPAS